MQFRWAIRLAFCLLSCLVLYQTGIVGPAWVHSNVSFAKSSACFIRSGHLPTSSVAFSPLIPMFLSFSFEFAPSFSAVVTLPISASAYVIRFYRFPGHLFCILSCHHLCLCLIVTALLLCCRPFGYQPKWIHGQSEKTDKLILGKIRQQLLGTVEGP